jgi:tetratricopeptide (TPR) repeat protein
MKFPARFLNQGWLFGLVLVAATLIAYLPALRGGFVWDDEAHIPPHRLGALAGLSDIWLHPGATQQYYPLVFSIFWLEHKLWGDATLGYHLVNVFLHCLGALLFLRILRALEVPGAWLAAAIFALHPVHVESVAWMTELKNTLSGVLYLGSVLAYVKFDQTRSKAFCVLAWGLFALGLTAKTAIAPLPAGLLVLIWWKRGRIAWKSDVLPLMPFFLVGLAAGIFTASIEQKLFGAGGREFNFSIVERCLIAGRSLWFHLDKLFRPVGLAFMYPRWEISQSVWWQYLYPGAALALAATCWALRRWSRGPLAALLFFAGTLFPALGFFNAYSFRYSFVNNHHQYLASLGIIALVSAGAAWLLGRWRLWGRMGGNLLCLALLATLAGLTWRQSGTYVDIETLWRATLTAYPKAFLAHNNLGVVLLEKGQIDEALIHFQAAQSIMPGFAEAHSNIAAAVRALAVQKLIMPGFAEAQSNLGDALFRKRQLDEAIAQCQEALHLDPNLASAHNNLGLALLQEGQVGEAIAHFQAALASRPDLADIHNNFGSALRQNGQADAAIAQYQAALEIQPRNAKACFNLGVTLVLQGQASAAISSFQKALAIQPDFAEAHRELARALLQNGQSSEAVAHLRKALELQPDLAAASFDLGNALVEHGQVDEAIALFQKAVQIDPQLAAAQSNLGNALLRRGRVEEALAHYQAAIEAQPTNAFLLNNLAWVLATCPQASVRNGARAVELAQQADQLSGSKDSWILGTLAAAYAEAGRFAEAVAAARHALELAAAQTNSAHVEILRAHLRLYQAGSPFRDRGQANAAPHPNPL